MSEAEKGIKRGDRIRLSRRYFVEYPNTTRPKKRYGTVTAIGNRTTSLVYVRWDGLRSIRGECARWIQKTGEATSGER